MPVNWCTSCKVGLANEEVVNGVCERCGSPVVRKMKSQWMLKITEYADKLIDGLDSVDYVEKVKVSQRNWIGRSNGAEVDFRMVCSMMSAASFSFLLTDGVAMSFFSKSTAQSLVQMISFASIQHARILYLV